MAAKDKVISAREMRIKTLSDEIDRRKFVDAKVKENVNSLVAQNAKMKNIIQ